jgi:hypothetical protein
VALKKSTMQQKQPTLIATSAAFLVFKSFVGVGVGGVIGGGGEIGESLISG